MPKLVMGMPIGGGINREASANGGGAPGVTKGTPPAAPINAAAVAAAMGGGWVASKNWPVNGGPSLLKPAALFCCCWRN